MKIAAYFRSLVAGAVAAGEAIADTAVDRVFDTAAEAANLIPIPQTRAAALKLIADARVNVRNAIDTLGNDAGELAGAFVDDVTTAFANAEQAANDATTLDAAVHAAIGQLQTLLAQHHAGVSPTAAKP